MQQLITLFILLLVQTAPPKLVFQEKEFSFGKVREGKVVNVSIDFENKGESPLIIHEISGSCGCTAVSFPPYPIKPKAMDKLYVKFLTKGKNGFQDLEIHIKSNAQKKEQVLHITGEVFRH